MIDSKNYIRQTYTGKLGSDYHANVHSFDNEILKIIARQRLRKIQPLISSDDTILEFGVGLGLNLLYLNCKRKVGYDASDAGREICTANNIEFTTDATSIEEEKFSVVLCHHVLEHVPDPINVLEQIKEFLTPDGKLILCVPFEANRHFRRFYPGDPNKHLFSWNVLTLGNLVSTLGFKIEYVKVHPFGYERRLAFLAKYGFLIYNMGLWILRKLLPVEEIVLIAKK